MLNVSSESLHPFTLQLLAKLKRHPKRICFTEGEDLRVLKAAQQLVAFEAISPILLGDKQKMLDLAEANNINTNFINFLDPKESSDLELFCKRYEKIERYRGREVNNVQEVLTRPHNFAAMMLQYGQTDGLIAGNMSQPTTVFRALMNFIKPIADVPKIFGSVIMHSDTLTHFGRDNILFLSDCGVNPEPTIEELAHIAIETGKLAEHFLERSPRIVMLSHSTHGSMHSKSAEKMATATELARSLAKQNHLDFIIDGELQADVALDMNAAEMKYKDQRGLNAADVLIFPNLDSSHITYKLLQHIGNADTYGQIVMGLTKHAAQIPKTASIDMIIGTAALVGYESVKYREHHSLS